MTFDPCICLGARIKLRVSGEIVAHEVIALLEALGSTEQAHHIEVEDRLGFEMVSNGGMVSLKDEDIRQAQGRGAEEFGLERQSISITTGEIEDHLHPFCLQQGAYRKGSQPHDGILKVWHIDRIHAPLEEFRIFIKFRKIVSLGGLEFSNYNKFP